MTLKPKLTGTFLLVSLGALVASAFGYWQIQKLAAALYQADAVQLPSEVALDTILEAESVLKASKRELLREATLFENDSRPAESQVQAPRPGSPGDPIVVLSWQSWAGVLQEELQRQKEAWARADQGRKAYEPLLRTPEDENRWKDFVEAWNVWRTHYEKVMTHLTRARATGDRTLLTSAREENFKYLYEPARVSHEQLTGLLQRNEESAAIAKRESIATQREMEMIGYFLLAAAGASVVAAIVAGLVLGGQIGRPLRQMAAACGQVAKGNLGTAVPVGSRDEIGQLADTMNRMVEALRVGELRYRAVFENSADAISVTKKSHLVMANPALPALFGYDPGETVIGRPVFDFIAPEDRPFMLDRIRLQDRGQALAPRYELTGLRKDGTKFAMEVQSATFTFQGEKYTVDIQREITAPRGDAETI